MFDKIETVFDGKKAILVRGLGRYDLKNTMECGQCFRYERLPRNDGADEYMTVVGNELIRVAQVTPGELIFPEMSDAVFYNVAVPYFALERNLDYI